MVSRILSILKQKNLSISQFAEEIGIQKSGMSHLISGRNKPSLELILKILQKYPDIKPEWLLFGTMQKVSDDKTPVTSSPPENVLVKTAASPATLFDFSGESNSCEASLSEDLGESVTEPGPIRDSIDQKKRVVKTKEGVSLNADQEIERMVIFFNDCTFRTYSPR